ncbi:hypothetical protein FF36_05316 [Frankia torreyi]|uniref:Uncharacterized protein n=1 Tax=Frankia torreyi TaxID=1856 RepID=A0A0D8BAF3_9ACTN|nr:MULTISPECIES: hypothetical protein [Frankia]KJE20342.1 hypothetical protein FF36_05316 [Frankia torreyi]KQM02754.1 hypothetical protein FF86_105746 [Frankia sp. CpI1-P]
MAGDLTRDQVDAVITSILEGLDRNGYREAVLADVDPAKLPAVLAAEARGRQDMKARGYEYRGRRGRR